MRSQFLLRAKLLAFAPLVLVACSGSPTTVTEKVDASKEDAAHNGPAADGAVDGPGSAGDAGPTLVIEPGQGMTPIYDFINTAKKSIDITMYEFTDTMITGLLTVAAKNGVTVRVILDTNLEKSSNTTAFTALNAGGVQAHWANPTYAATHQKTITIDGTTSAIMTLNFTPEYYMTTRDFAVITTDAKDVAAIEAVFNADFASAAITPALGDDLIWSPTNSESAILGLINGAKTSLLIENEEMGYDEVVSALSSAAMRGVNVEVVMTASKTWDTEFTTLKAAGVKVVTYARSAPLYIHAKVILADYGKSGASVFIGSENFSYSSLDKNRELGVILTDPAILTTINTTLSSDYSGATAF